MLTSKTHPARFTLGRAAAFSTVLCVLGVFAVFSTCVYLYGLWTTDALKSIGGLVPLVSLVLILRAWRALGWEQRGTWWGLALIAVTVVVVHIRDHAIIELVLGPSWSIFIPPHSLVAFVYVSGAVLLFGGTRLYRAAVFPIALMWFVNPVPNFFTLHVDLPLQHASAHVARSWAQHLGYPLTPDNLRLMFTPDFGMFIAPGCNGIRGAITMGFIALVASFVYRFRLLHRVLVVLGAIALGYVFNFIRLCVLVLYYIVAVHWKWMQPHAEMGDYLIGAALFLLATLLLFTLILRLSPARSITPPQLPYAPLEPLAASAPAGFLPRFAAMSVLVALGSTSYARALVEHTPGQARISADSKALGLFPEQVGRYHLERRWNEYLVTGPLIFYWADYAPAGGDGARISVGLSPVLGAHDTLLCHAARGEDWLWHDNIVLADAHAPTSFSASFFNDGAVQYLEATTVCSGATCGQYSTSRQHFGLIYSRPDTATLLTQSPTRPIPVLFRVETADTALAPDLARSELTGDLRTFLQAADLASFTAPYRTP